MYYTIKPKKSKENLYTLPEIPNFSKNQECTKLSRCHDFRTCPTCSKIHQKNIKKKLLSHLDDEIIESYQYKYFIRFRNNDKFELNVLEKNKVVNLFMQKFTRSKHKKDFVIDEKAEYFYNKEISKNDNYDYNPHTHMVLLTDKEFDINNPLFKDLLEFYNIDFHIEDIYKRDNSYLKSLECILHYINKFDENTAKIQRETKLLKGEHSNKHTKLFKINEIESIILDLPIRQKEIYSKFFLLISFYFLTLKELLNQKLYIKIMEEAKQKTIQAKSIFKRNANKKHIKNYLRLLKSLRKKLKKIEIWKKRKKQALKGFRPFF